MYRTYGSRAMQDAIADSTTRQESTMFWGSRRPILLGAFSLGSVFFNAKEAENCSCIFCIQTILVIIKPAPKVEAFELNQENIKKRNRKNGGPTPT